MSRNIFTYKTVQLAPQPLLQKQEEAFIYAHTRKSLKHVMPNLHLQHRCKIVKPCAPTKQQVFNVNRLFVSFTVNVYICSFRSLLHLIKSKKKSWCWWCTGHLFVNFQYAPYRWLSAQQCTICARRTLQQHFSELVSISTLNRIITIDLTHFVGHSEF